MQLKYAPKTKIMHFKYAHKEILNQKNKDATKLYYILHTCFFIHPMYCSTEQYKISGFKFASVTSCDVERTFSQYKNLLRPNRQQIKNENLPLYTIPYCNTWDE